MKKHYAVWLMVSGLVSSSSASDLTAAIEAKSANPSLGDQAQILGRIVGTWDVAYTDFTKDGNAIHRTGEFIVSWVLDGRAVQDLWIVDPSGTRKEREVYTDLHWFDTKSRYPPRFVRLAR